MRRANCITLSFSILFVSCTMLVSSSAAAEQASSKDTGRQAAESRLGSLAYWDDGLAEMAYYKATDTIYGEPRSFTRVHLVNRQWMDPRSGVKADRKTPGAVPVLKLNVVEEIPTENYNYRFQTTLFLRRADLTPFKMAVSSQEWCGTTYKHLRWNDDALKIDSRSYFPNEGDRTWQVSADATPLEALLLIARDVVADDQPRNLNVLASFRSSHQVEPSSMSARLVVAAAVTVTVGADRFDARRVDVQWGGQLTGFVVEAAPPYRLLRFRMGVLRGELLSIERRPYWDRTSKSSFHKPGEAP